MYYSTVTDSIPNLGSAKNEKSIVAISLHQYRNCRGDTRSNMLKARKIRRGYESNLREYKMRIDSSEASSTNTR
jgi:hypothetical protein